MPGPRINKEGFIDPVRLIDNNGKMIGVVKLQKALDMAEDIGLDLVEVSLMLNLLFVKY